MNLCGEMHLDKRTTASDRTVQGILEEFGEHTQRLEVHFEPLERDRMTDARFIRFFQRIWLHIDSRNLQKLKVHPLYLDAARVNVFGSELAEFPELEELDLNIPLIGENLNSDEPFDIWCPKLKVLRLSGNFGIEMPADRSPTMLQTLEIAFNCLLDEDKVKALLKLNPNLSELILRGVDDVDDLNEFLDYLVSIEMHRTLTGLVLQLRHDASNNELPHIIYTLRPTLMQFTQLRTLDIAGFGNLAIKGNAHLFGMLENLEVLVISSPLWNLAMEVNVEFLRTFAANAPPKLRKFWLKRLMVKRTVWEAFLKLMPKTCECYKIATG